MTKKNPPQSIESTPDVHIGDFRRTQRFETAKNWIQIGLMVVLALALCVFLVLIIIAGVTQSKLPDTEGVRALQKLFVEITSNAKTVVLFGLGFFFREYLNGRLMGGN